MILLEIAAGSVVSVRSIIGGDNLVGIVALVGASRISEAAEDIKSVLLCSKEES